MFSPPEGHHPEGVPVGGEKGWGNARLCEKNRPGGNCQRKSGIIQRGGPCPATKVSQNSAARWWWCGLRQWRGGNIVPVGSLSSCTLPTSVHSELIQLLANTLTQRGFHKKKSPVGGNGGVAVHWVGGCGSVAMGYGGHAFQKKTTGAGPSNRF